MTDKFYPMLGDVYLLNDNMQNGVGPFHHYIQEVAENPGIDFRFVQYGDRGVVECASVKAMDELEKQVPHKIDRLEAEYNPVWNLFPTSFILHKSTQQGMERKKATIEFLGINRASRFIPIIFESVNKHIGSFKSGQEINFK